MEGVAVAVTHVPGTRSRELQLLRAELGGARIPHDVVTDPYREGVWPTTRRAWLRALELAEAEELSHVMVMQDDMLPVRGFGEGSTEALRANPNVVVNFFCSRPTLAEQARELGVHWGIAQDGTWGGTMAMPVDMARDFLAWEERMVPADYPHDDRRVTMYILTHYGTIWMTLPSLIEHTLPKESLLGHSNGRYRTAAWLAEDARGIDWTRGLPPSKPVKAPTRIAKDIAVIMEGWK